MWWYFARCVTILYTVLLCLSCTLRTSYARWNTQDYLKREHSLMKPYHGSGAFLPNWDFVGSTLITTNYIRLTADVQSSSGALWNKIPCVVPNWELHVHFRVYGKGKDLFGDGMALWYTRDPLQMGSIFGNEELFHGLAIFMDTYANQNGPHNHGHPYISAMVNNGSMHYDHDRDGTHTELSGCESKFRGSDHDTFISVRYENDVLTVSTDMEGKNAWQECFQVKGVKLPTGYFFGASAATGDLSDNHDIISMKLYELEGPTDSKDKEDRSKIQPSASLFASPRDHVDDPVPPMSGTKFFLIVFCAIIGIGLCVVIGIMVFQRQQETSRKRFY